MANVDVLEEVAMKQQLIRIAGVFCILLMAAAAMAGTWSSNKFLYQPDQGARGATEKSTFDTGLTRVDAHLGQYKTLGDPGYSTLAEALTTIGSNNVTLTIPAGTVTIASNTTIGNNIALRVFKGGKFNVNSGITLAINGPVDAGPYQIFSGTGTVTLGGVSTIYDVWYAVTPSNPEGNIAAPIGSRFVKTAGSAPLVYVKESGTGTSGWVASSGGSGAAAFTGLTDVPGSYSDQAGKALRVNANSNGLEFYNPPIGGVRPFITLGETGYVTLSQALSTIGSTKTTMIIPAEAGVVPITCNTTIPANVDLRVLKGARLDVANGFALNINGSIEAGPYQIFSWNGTGALNLRYCQNSHYLFEWWGPQEGIANDVSSALVKAADSLRWTDKTIDVSPGQWRIATPVVINTQGGTFKVRGAGPGQSVFYIDVGNNIGINIENAIYITTVDIQGVSFGGPANCCTNALRISNVAHVRLDVNFWLGCTDYALVLENCVWAKGYVRTRHNLPLGYETYAECAKGIHITNSAASGGENVLDLRVALNAQGCNPPLLLDGSYNPGVVMKLTGSIEAWGSGGPFNIQKAQLLRIADLYLEGGAGTAQITDCLGVKVENLLINSSSADLRLSNTKHAFINNYSLGRDLIIDADCQNTVVGVGKLSSGGVIRDNAPDTTFVGGSDSGNSYNNQALPAPGFDNKNYIHNALFSRWQSDRPDGGWGKDSHTTWVRCGDGQTDTTKHISPYCAKLSTDAAADITTYYYADSDQLTQFRGQLVNVGFWGLIPTGQTLGTYPRLFLNFTCPAWQANSSYLVGQGVTDGGNNTYVCVTAGTSGSQQPTWNNTAGATTTDGTVVWRAGLCTGCSNPQANWLRGVGIWQRINTNCYCPTNATNMSWYTITWRQTGGAATTWYMAEPSITLGRYMPRVPTPGIGEFSSDITFAGIRVTAGPSASGTPTGWRSQGDQHWWTNPTAGQSPGVVATADGNPATWKAMPALGN
jgi:hypothetical protein